jgi:uncharacterized Fe-S cluster-containing radical SAM superfamily protein
VTLPATDVLRRRYFEEVAAERESRAANDPLCLYLEVTNRCNLPCTTCPRTYEELEPERDMSFELFTSIVDQASGIRRVVLHGVGEPMMVKELPRMVAYLKARRVYVLFNTNGTLLKIKKSRELIEAGLDELRVSLDAAEAGAYAKVRGRDMFDAIVRNLRGFLALKRDMNVEHPRVSLWLTGAEGDDRAASRLRTPCERHRRHRGAPATTRLFPGRPGYGATPLLPSSTASRRASASISTRPNA